MQIPITPPYIKLSSLLKFAGIAETGGHATDLILNGDVILNGQPCLMRGKKIVPGDIIKIEKDTIKETIEIICK